LYTFYDNGKARTDTYIQMSEVDYPIWRIENWLTHTNVTRWCSDMCGRGKTWSVSSTVIRVYSCLPRIAPSLSLVMRVTLPPCCRLFQLRIVYLLIWMSTRLLQVAWRMKRRICC
jgi:hypothetical protein